jgi:uncharacterized membrane protein YgdD (TMEM256/DUF423 family)
MFQMRVLIIAAVVCGLLLVIAGAAGGHASAFGLTATSEAVFREGVIRRVAWDSAMLLGLVHVLAALLACALPLGPMRVWGGWAFLAGVVFFSFALLTKAFIEMRGGSAPLGMLAPVGGVSFMIGWVLLLVSAVRAKPATE